MSTDTHKPDGWSVLSNVAQNAEWRRFPSDNLRNSPYSREVVQGFLDGEYARERLMAEAVTVAGTMTPYEIGVFLKDMAETMLPRAKR